MREYTLNSQTLRSFLIVYVRVARVERERERERDDTERERERERKDIPDQKKRRSTKISSTFGPDFSIFFKRKKKQNSSSDLHRDAIATFRYFFVVVVVLSFVLFVACQRNEKSRDEREKKAK